MKYQLVFDAIDELYPKAFQTSATIYATNLVELMAKFHIEIFKTQKLINDLERARLASVKDDDIPF